MDQGSWFWMSKRLDKNPSETNSITSTSSHSEKSSDDQAVSEDAKYELQEIVNFLSKKLSDALRSLKAKDDLVKQHIRVAEEAVSGLEQAEIEVIVLKQQLKTMNQKNSSLEERVIHLDEALKETRNHKRSFSEQDEKVVDVSGADHFSELELAKEENSKLRDELFSISEKLNILSLERDLSISKAETSSKQLLETAKKLTMLEAECRKRQAVTSGSSDTWTLSTISHSMESVGESLQNSRGRFHVVDCGRKPIQEDDNTHARNFAKPSPDIDLMDDFLEMERLVSSPRAEKEIEPTVREKSEMEMVLGETRKLLDIYKNQLVIAEEKILELRQQLDLSISSKNASEEDMEGIEMDEKVLCFEKADESEKRGSDSQVDLARLEIEELKQQLISMRQEAILHESLSVELEAKSRVLGVVESEKKTLESRLKAADSEIGKLRFKVHVLEGKLEEEKAISAKCEAKVNLADAERRKMEAELVSACAEAAELRERASYLESNLDKEIALSAEMAAKCKNLEVELSKKNKMETELNTSCSYKGLKISQKELVSVAEKFAECQKTITSLSLQLQSLTSSEESRPPVVEIPEAIRSTPEDETEDFRSLRSSHVAGILCSPSFFGK